MYKTVTNNDGDYSLSGLPDGSYTVKFYYPGFLVKKVLIAISGGVNITLPATTTLLGGDITSDNYISFDDFTYFVKSLDSLNNNENYEIFADIDSDGYVSFSDFALFVLNLDIVGD